MRNVLFFCVIFVLTSTCTPQSSVNIAPIVTGVLDPQDFQTVKPLITKEGEGIFINISGDGLVDSPDWRGDLDQLSKEQITAALQRYIGSYAESESQVSALLFNINYQRACYDSKVMEPYWAVRNPEKDVTGWPRKHWQIHKKGIDIYEVCIAGSRQKHLSPWLSVRMNDHHYFNDSSRINRLWWNHPEYRRTPSSQFNYARSEVRSYYKSFISEALDRYDVDGIELDWMRTHTVFKQGEEGLGNDLLNEFMKEVRILVNQKAAERGHSIKIGVRVPSSPSISRSLGLNGVVWVQRGYVDVLTPTNWYHPTNYDLPLEEWRSAIGSGSNYTLAAGADVGYMLAANATMKRLSSNIEGMRGFAQTAYSRGADAVYWFNNWSSGIGRKVINKDGSSYMTNDKPLLLRETGRYATLAGKPRSHVYTYVEPDVKAVPKDGYGLSPGVERIFRLYSGPRPTGGKYTVRIGLESMSGYQNADLSVKVNGNLGVRVEDMPVTPTYRYDNTKQNEYVFNVAETSARVMQYQIALSDVQDGYNSIGIVNNKNEIQKITWLEVFIE